MSVTWAPTSALLQGDTVVVTALEAGTRVPWGHTRTSTGRER